ncbi:MAG TPA: hypothetical protein VFT57_02215, partial [Gemmatimonadaceae bacterium]|nr:hypothetical protein [Gemmatimonadaceae bacterium]
MAARKRKPSNGKKNEVTTATGRRADRAVREEAEKESREGLRERTEAGHRKAGRVPPSDGNG